MTEETARLDYGKPPPDYAEALARPLVAYGSDIDVKKLEADLADWKRSGMLVAPADAKVTFPSLAEMWAHHKAHNDPPGMRTAWSTGDAVTPLPLEVLVEARAKAWAWHDRRHALAARPTLQNAWPSCLRWTDSECDQVDRWIARGEETPEAFWALLKPVAELLAVHGPSERGQLRGRVPGMVTVDEASHGLDAATRNVDEPANEPTRRPT